MVAAKSTLVASCQKSFMALTRLQRILLIKAMSSLSRQASAFAIPLSAFVSSSAIVDRALLMLSVKSPTQSASSPPLTRPSVILLSWASRFLTTSRTALSSSEMTWPRLPTTLPTVDPRSPTTLPRLRPPSRSQGMALALTDYKMKEKQKS